MRSYYFVNAVQEGNRPVIDRVHDVPHLKKEDNAGLEPPVGQALVKVVVANTPDEVLDRGGGNA